MNKRGVIPIKQPTKIQIDFDLNEREMNTFCEKMNFFFKLTITMHQCKNESFHCSGDIFVSVMIFEQKNSI